MNMKYDHGFKELGLTEGLAGGKDKYSSCFQPSSLRSWPLWLAC